MSLNIATTILSASVSLTTLCGIAFHESKIDKLMTATTGYSALVATHEIANLRGDPHTHVERVSVKNAFGNRTPANRLRYGEIKQHMLQQNVPHGFHPFDSYFLPY